MIEKNKPIVNVISYNPYNPTIKIEKFTSSFDNAELIQGGERVPLQSLGLLNFVDYSPIEMRNFVRRYIEKAAELFPRSCNNNLKIELII